MRDEDDVPVARRRRVIMTEALDERTRPRPTGSTEKLPPMSLDEPPPLLHEPTHILDSPTTQVRAAKAPPEPPPLHVDRTAADHLAAAQRAFNREQQPITASLIAGLVAGIADEPAESTVAHVAKRLVHRTTLADRGIGGGLSESQLAHLLVDVATEVLGGVDALRQAQLKLAKEFRGLITRYQTLAETAEKRNDTEGALMWRTRAQEIAAQERRLRLGLST
jgi:hypothetical protein